MIKTSDIINKVFSKSFMGYDVVEVDAYLDEIIDEIDRLQKERVEMAEALEQLLLELDRRDGKLPAGRMELTAGEREKRADLTPGARHIAARSAVRQEKLSAIPEEAARAIVDSVALEIETGAAAPRRKVACAEEAKAAASGQTDEKRKADLS